MEDAVRHLGKLNPLLGSVPQGPRHCSEDNNPRGTCETSSVEDSEDQPLLVISPIFPGRCFGFVLIVLPPSPSGASFTSCPLFPLGLYTHT